MIAPAELQVRSKEVAADLQNRYHFHMAAQNILSSLNSHHSRVQGWLNYLAGQRQLPAEVFQQAMGVLRDAHSNLELQLIEAGKLRLPELKNVTAGQLLGPFLMGWLKDMFGSTDSGILTLVMLLVVAAVITATLPRTETAAA